MSEKQSAPWLTPEQSARLNARTDMLLRVLNGDPPALVMDALLSAFATVTVGFSVGAQGAHMLRLAADILDKAKTPEDVQAAVYAVPAAALKVPMPDRPAGPLPDGYASDDVARIEALVRAVLGLIESEKAHNALSALITCFVQVADHVEETHKMGRVLLETGGRMIASPPAASKAEADPPVPTINAKLH